MEEITPQDYIPDFESQCLYELLNNIEYFKSTFQFLTEEHFTSIEKKSLFNYIKEYSINYDGLPSKKEIGLSIVNDKSVNENLKSLILTDFKTVVYQSPVKNTKFLIDKTEEHIQRIELVNAIYNSYKIIEEEGDSGQILGIIEKALSIQFDYDTGLDYKNSAKERYEYYTSSENAISTGIPSLDLALGGGYRDATLSIISSFSHGGKSSLCIASAAHAAALAKNVLFLTLEMTEFEVAKRFDGNLMDHVVNDLSELSEEEYLSKFEKIKPYLNKIKIKEYGSGALCTLGIKTLLNTLEKEDSFKPDIIYVDYLALMKSNRMNFSDNTNTYYGAVAEELHALCKELCLPIVAPMQLNRSADGNLDVGASAIAESIKVFATADNVIMLLNNEALREQKQTLAKFVKNRNTGRLSSSLLNSDFSKMQYSDADESSFSSNVENKDTLKALNTDVFKI